MNNPHAGKVFLVGAGPGDPGLLTCKARELIDNCDVVCYDLLISSAILSLVPPDTELLPIGYRGYKGSHIDYGMHPTVIEQALLGKTVVRLKAGDPFIFGRATEECNDLIDNGIEYEAVPGITAALGAATYAGFPLTSAGIASDVTFASGHKSSKTISSWASLGSSTGTLVLYMGAKKLAEHAIKLINAGRDANTPVAHISAATSASQVITQGTLEDIGPKVLALDCHDPALVIMGNAVTLSEKLDWRNKLPLANKRIIALGNNTLFEKLQQLGAEVIQPNLYSTVNSISDESWSRISKADKVAFADPGAVKAWQEQLQQRQIDIRDIAYELISINKTSTDQLRSLGFYNIVEKSIESLEKHIPVLGEAYATNTTAWSRQPNPLRYPIETPDMIISEDEYALSLLFEAYPEFRKLTLLNSMEEAMDLYTSDIAVKQPIGSQLEHCL